MASLPSWRRHLGSSSDGGRLLSSENSASAPAFACFVCIVQVGLVVGLCSLADALPPFCSGGCFVAVIVLVIASGGCFAVLLGLVDALPL